MIRLIRSMDTIEDIVSVTSLKAMSDATMMLMLRVRDANPKPSLKYLQCEVSRKEIMDVDDTFYVLNKETFSQAGFIEETKEKNL